VTVPLLWRYLGSSVGQLLVDCHYTDVDYLDFTEHAVLDSIESSHVNNFHHAIACTDYLNGSTLSQSLNVRITNLMYFHDNLEF